MNFYTSDLHLGHINVTQAGKNFDNRPFKDVEEMNKVLCENWNNTVGKGDTVYVLGDCIWNSDYNIYEEFSKLNGNKILIKGNHCRTNNPEYKKLFQTICDYREIKDVVDDQTYNLVLCHYPILMWNKQHYGAIHLYGHVHNSREYELYKKCLNELKDDNGKSFKAYNVGCMLWNYKPVTLKEILVADGVIKAD